MDLNEQQIIEQIVIPALYEAGWTSDQIVREPKVRSGLKGRRYTFVDIMLQIRIKPREHPIVIGVIEVRKNRNLSEKDIQITESYASLLNVKFALLTNGQQIKYINYITKERSQSLTLDKIPSPDQLKSQYERWLGVNLEEDVALPLRVPYVGGEDAPRLHQDAAIRAVLESYLSGKRRIAVNLVTGSGRTFVMANLIRRLIDSKQIANVLYLTDRQELAQQAYQSLIEILDSEFVYLYKGMSDLSGSVVISTIQKLFLIDPDDFMQRFDLVIYSDIRISKDTKSREILLKSNLLVGFYSTPEMIPHDIFDSIAYTYSVEQAIDDGYLKRESEKSQFRISDTTPFIPVHNPLDVITSEPISDDRLLNQYSVFISYRRDDSAYIVRKIFNHLNKDLELQNHHQIFMDRASIRYGDDFVDSIMTAIDSCSVVVVVIGRQWLNITDVDGNSRLNNPNDYVRREVEAAIGNEKVILPVLVNQASMPGAHRLPESMIKLSRINAFEIVHKEEYFEQEMKQLTKALKDLLKMTARRND